MPCCQAASADHICLITWPEQRLEAPFSLNLCATAVYGKIDPCDKMKTCEHMLLYRTSRAISCGLQNPLTQEWEAASAVHRTLNQFRFGNHSFNRPVAVRKSESGLKSRELFLKPLCEIL